MTEALETHIPVSPLSTATVTGEQPVAAPPLLPAELQALEQRLTLMIAGSNGIRAEEIRQVRDVIGDIKRDIQQIRAHQENQDRRTDSLENELRPAIQEIKANSGRIDTTLTSINALLERDRKTVDDHTASIQQLHRRQADSAEKTATIDRDVGDLRTRLADVVNPLASMVLGDPKTPSMLERLDNIRRDMELDRQKFYESLEQLETSVKPVIQTVTAWRDHLQEARNFFKSRRGMTIVFGGCVLIIELFSKIDLVGLTRSLITLFTGGVL